MAIMNSKPLFGSTAKTQAKQLKKLQKFDKKMKDLERKQQLTRKKQETTNVKRTSNLESSNPVKRLIAQHQQKSIAKQESRLRELEAKTKTAELQPELTAQTARAEARVKVAKAQAGAKFAGYSAVAMGASRLGQGLSDEQNQDDEKNRQHQSDIVKTITGNDDSSGLEQGVL